MMQHGIDESGEALLEAVRAAALETLKAAVGVSQPMERNLALENVATALAAAGDATNAREAASAISLPGTRDSARSSVAQTLAEAGDIAAAQETAQTIDQLRSRASAQCAIANAAASAGDVALARQFASEARATASAISDVDERAFMVKWVAAKLTAEWGASAAGTNGDVAEIRRRWASAADMDNPEQKTKMFVDIARELIAAGDVPAAKEAAAAARAAAAAEPSWPFISEANRAGAMIAAAEVLALAGEGSAASAAAASLEDPWYRCLAHVAVAKGLVTAGSPAEGRAAVIAALQDAAALDVGPVDMAQTLTEVAVAARRAAVASSKALPNGGVSRDE